MDRLRVGDVIVVSDTSGHQKEYPVLQIRGDVAVTRYRDFGPKIVNGWLVFEAGQRNSETTNSYFVKERS